MLGLSLGLWNVGGSTGPSKRFAFDFVRVDLDDANGVGGVSFPRSIIVNGITFALIDPAGPAPSSAILPLNGLTADQLSIQLLRSDEWVFASEFAFEGRINSMGVPESASFLAWAVGILSLVSIVRTQSRLRFRNA